MIKKLVFLFTLIIVIYNLNGQGLKLYPFKSGMIKYKLEGKTYANETIYFDDYGRFTSNLNTKHDSILTILRYDTIYELNIKTNSLIIIPTDENTFNSKQKLISQETLKTLGFLKSNTENIAGIQCNKYVGENGSLWVWNSIVLKSEMEILDTKISIEATEVLIGIDIPKSKFEIPNNY